MADLSENGEVIVVLAALTATFCTLMSLLDIVCFCSASLEMVAGADGEDSVGDAFVTDGASSLGPNRMGTVGTSGVRSPLRQVPILGVVTKGVVIMFHHPCDRLGVGTAEVSIASDVSIVRFRSGVSSSSKTVSDDMIRSFFFDFSTWSNAVPAESSVSFLACLYVVSGSRLESALTASSSEDMDSPMGRDGTGGTSALLEWNWWWEYTLGVYSDSVKGVSGDQADCIGAAGVMMIVGVTGVTLLPARGRVV